MKTILVVTWPRGKRGRDTEDGQVWHWGDAPTAHPRFKDAVLNAAGDAWVWQRPTTLREVDRLGRDALQHLRSWDIAATYTIERK